MLSCRFIWNWWYAWFSKWNLVNLTNRRFKNLVIWMDRVNEVRKIALSISKSEELIKSSWSIILQRSKLIQWVKLVRFLKREGKRRRVGTGWLTLECLKFLEQYEIERVGTGLLQKCPTLGQEKCYPYIWLIHNYM